MNTLKFDRVECGRCGGTGEYSFNQKDGTVCFGCKGKGKIMTKRGKAAAQWFIDQTTTTIKAVKAGDKVRIYADTYTVEQITEKGGVYTFDTTVKGKKHGFGYKADTPARIILEGEEKNTLMTQAIEYQNNLTKAGKQKKRAA